MNLKSYSRGIGIGIIVAAVVMGVATKDASPVKAEESNETLKESALSVSISEIPVSDPGDVTVDVTGDEVLVSGNDASEDEKSESGEAETETEENENTGAETEETVEEEETTEVTPPAIDPLPDDDDGYTITDETVEIKVVRGDSSVTVARRMYEAGLIESAVEFDKYLCSNGFDKKICTGTYQMAYNLTFEEYANILMKKK